MHQNMSSTKSIYFMFLTVKTPKHNLKNLSFNYQFNLTFVSCSATEKTMLYILYIICINSMIILVFWIDRTWRELLQKERNRLFNGLLFFNKYKALNCSWCTKRETYRYGTYIVNKSYSIGIGLKVHAERHTKTTTTTGKTTSAKLVN